MILRRGRCLSLLERQGNKNLPDRVEPSTKGSLMNLIDLRDIVLQRGEETVLDIPEFRLKKGSHTLLTGRSGSGKSSLVHLLAGFLRPLSGSYRLDGEEVAGLSEREWDRLRSRRIGVVFQHYPLLRAFDLLDNLLIPMRLAGRLDRERAQRLLQEVGLGHRLHHRPSQLSAGQRQRAAVVRSMVGQPTLVLADEPTAHLDGETGRSSLELLRELCRQNDSTLLVVSHDSDLEGQFDRSVRLEDKNRAAAGYATAEAPE